MLNRFCLCSSFIRVAVVAAYAVLAGQCAAQSYIYAPGSPTFSTAYPVDGGFINVANGNLHLEIPIASPPQRGSLVAVEKLTYDSRIWQPVGGVWQPTNIPGSMLGWRFESPVKAGVSNIPATTACDTRSGSATNYSDWSWTAPDGTVRTFSSIQTERDPNNCEGGTISSADAAADDSSGYHMYVTNITSAKVLAPDGTQVYPTVMDTNGNSFSSDGNGNLVDTLGRTPVAHSTGTNQDFYDVLGSDGSTHRITVTYALQTATSAFSQYTNQSISQNAITRIDLPDGSYYAFSYDSWGELSNITFPTGGGFEYFYQTFTDAFGLQNRWISEANGAGGQSYFAQQVLATSTCQALQSGTVTGCQQVTVTKPMNDTVQYIFSLNGGAWNSQATYLNPDGTTAAIVTNTYDLSNTCVCGSAGYVRNLTSKTQMPTVNNQSLYKQTVYNYDSIYNGNITAVKEWNFTTGSFAPAPDRETDISYATSAPYVSANMINRPTQITIVSGGATVAQTIYVLDTATPLQQLTGITHHDDTAYGTNNTTRGNITQIQQLISGSTYWNTTLTYDMTGQIRQSKDNNNNAIFFDYADSYFNDNGGNPPVSATPPNGPTNAYVTTVTMPLIGAQSQHYYFGSGKIAYTTDQNGATSYAHYQDPLDRGTLTIDAIGGWVLRSYASETQQDIYTGITSVTPSTGCTSCRHDRVTLDGWGRPTMTAIISDPDNEIDQVTSYDGDGRVGGVTNPYRSTFESTYGETDFFYDGLDRLYDTRRQDGTNHVRSAYGAALAASTTSICGVTAFPSTTTDEVGNTHLYWTDGFGRLVEVDEPDSSQNFSIATCYQYDPLNNLKQIVQRGGDTISSNWRNSSFTYDDLSRVIQQITPEAGSTTYSYTNNGNPCSGDPGLPCSRTDARAVTTTYSYDALNRLTGKSYSQTTPATPAVTFYYDQTAYNGLTIANGKGRRTGMIDGSGQTAFTYDGVGNIKAKRQTIAPTGSSLASMTETINYNYNYDSSISLLTYPTGRQVNFTYNNSQRLLSMVDNTSVYRNFVTNAHYFPDGQVSTAAHGAGINESNSYNNRLEVQSLSSTSSNQTLASFGFTYDRGGGLNNGSIVNMSNAVGARNPNNNRNLTFTYDQLNRLRTAGTVAGAGTPWSTTYTYDNWGNLLQKATTGPGEPSVGLFTADVSNRVNPTAYGYDAAGNLTFDGKDYLNFDAENQIHPVSGLQYYYDGDGHRVAKSDGSRYWYDDDFNVLSTADSSNTLKRDYVYFNGQKLGLVTVSSGDAHYYVNDHLGSPHVIANGDGTFVSWEADYFPYGGLNLISNADNLSVSYEFTGYEHDPETGNYYAEYREQSPVLGRFFSPDPYGGSVDLSNPQSLNRYAYTQNDPINAYDPNGLDCILTDGGIIFDFEWGPLVDPVEACREWNGTYEPPVNSSTTNGDSDPVDPEPFPVNQVPSSDGGGGSGGDGGGAGGSAGGNGSVQLTETPITEIVPNNPCQFAGSNPDPSSWATLGHSTRNNLFTTTFDGFVGFKKGGYLDGQPQATGNAYERAAYGNYVFGAYMSAAGFPLSVALDLANIAAARSKRANPSQYRGRSMDKKYHSLPPANVANITLGYAAQRSGKLCHK